MSRVIHGSAVRSPVSTGSISSVTPWKFQLARLAWLGGQRLRGPHGCPASASFDRPEPRTRLEHSTRRTVGGRVEDLRR